MLETFKYNGEELTLDITDEFLKALDIMENNESVFITGRAGTGKSSILKYFRSKSKKEIAVLSFTGLAAINVDGQTIHSFFGFPIGFIDPKQIFINRNLIDILRQVQTIVIDEISMVRADVLDAIDRSLKIHRGNTKHFGGVQMIFIGDLYQLPPIIEKDLAEVYSHFYKSPFFFHAEIFKVLKLPLINLEKIHRQKEEDLIEILNNVREKKNLPETLLNLNKRVVTDFSTLMDDDAIVLCTTNIKAKEINDLFLNRIELPSMNYRAKVSGAFDKGSYPTDENLVFKEGAKIIFIKNDSNKIFVNGDVGVIKKLDRNYIDVVTNGRLVRLKKEVWEKFKYKLKNGKVSKDIIGTFEQYPLKLAWAITIHKCIEENQLVKTRNGWKEIKNIDIGDEVLTHDLTYKQVLNKFNSGIQEVFKIETKNGLTLKATGLHPLLSENKWKLINDLKIGDSLITPIQNEGSVFELDKLGYLLGYLVGDGCYNSSNKNDSGRIEIIFNKKEISNIEIIKNIFDEYEIEYFIDENIKDSKTGNLKNLIRIRTHKKWFRTVLYNHGLLFTMKDKKDVPYTIMYGNSKIRASFIRGLFDSDGCADKLNVRVNNISKILLNKVQLLLNDFGIGSTLKRESITKLTRHQAYVLRISTTDLIKFRDFIGFNSEQKQFKLNKLINKVKLKQKVIHYNIKNNDEIKNLCVITKLLKFVTLSKTRKTISSSILRKILKKADNMNISYSDYLNLYAERLYTDDSIVSITKESEKQTYDIEVEDNSSFVAQGFICHNSQGQTYNNVIIDLDKGAFTSGQTYVALSRSRTMDGIKLKRAVIEKDIILDDRILEFKDIFLNE